MGKKASTFHCYYGVRWDVIWWAGAWSFRESVDRYYSQMALDSSHVENAIISPSSYDSARIPMIYSAPMNRCRESTSGSESFVIYTQLDSNLSGPMFNKISLECQHVVQSIWISSLAPCLFRKRVWGSKVFSTCMLRDMKFSNTPILKPRCFDEGFT